MLAIAVLILISISAAGFMRLGNPRGNERRELQSLWESSAYAEAYAQSAGLLAQKPLDFFLLTIHGFSAYQLAIAQINNSDTLRFIDDCIWSLRKALLSNEAEKDGRLFYVLGKAYYDKGQGYADLAVEYLEKARARGYEARDIPQYLGLAYAAIRDYRGSVAAFTLALGRDASDVLLLSIARSYIALEENDSARAYLLRCVDLSRDSKTKVAARLLLGDILVKAGDTAGAEDQYLKALEDGGENAEAHYQLGVLYDAGGDTTRARAEWRRAVRINPAHGPSRLKLNT
ncbi:tetratricopeptide repeat domain protein [Leadbettera azotonutricia ZAS-9]|uniref:Tetratricopeptide repeat domain protein n=1 Tax=Leadbettera azotonutricia (strain ATCC BAA-888 / DSM 13862 / ZAS-9) TaxID=545695 RepID=F5YC84_LEAAZ|nr:tetratricopeptide repeat domain protein [Leadbettera azotonutricia ZAS-9]